MQYGKQETCVYRLTDMLQQSLLNLKGVLKGGRAEQRQREYIRVRTNDLVRQYADDYGFTTTKVKHIMELSDLMLDPDALQQVLEDVSYADIS